MAIIPTISVIVPVYNRAVLMKRTLQSIAAQQSDDINIQLIIVDNASSDSSLEVAREWRKANQSSHLTIDVITEKRRGAAAARACGTSQATAPIVCFFDSDDEMPPGTLKSYIRAFTRHKDAQIVAGTAEIEYSNGRRSIFGHRRGDALVCHLHHSTLSTVRYAVKRDYLLACGGWNADINVWDDWELGMRLLISSPHIVKIDECVAHIHAQEESITGSCYAARSFEMYEQAIEAAEESVRTSYRKDRARLLGMLLYRRMTLSALFASEAHVLPDDAFSNDNLAYENRKKLEAASVGIAAETLRATYDMPYLRRRGLLRLILRLSRHWTSAGLRGAAILPTLFC